MADPNTVLVQARNLMREGQVQAADDLISLHFRELVKSGAPDPNLVAAPAPDRPPLVVVQDILTELIGLVGNKDSLLALINEFRAVL